MVKVRTTVLDNPNTMKKIERKTKKFQSKGSGEKDFDDSLDDDDKPMLERKVEKDEDDEKVFRTMLRLDDFDASISLFGIECIEKKQRFIESPKPRFQYGIAINGGMEPSMRYPKTDLYAWYENMEYRDAKYDELLDKLTNLGIKVIHL